MNNKMWVEAFQSLPKNEQEFYEDIKKNLKKEYRNSLTEWEKK